MRTPTTRRRFASWCGALAAVSLLFAASSVRAQEPPAPDATATPETSPTPDATPAPDATGCPHKAASGDHGAEGHACPHGAEGKACPHGAKKDCARGAKKDCAHGAKKDCAHGGKSAGCCGHAAPAVGPGTGRRLRPGGFAEVDFEGVNGRANSNAFDARRVVLMGGHRFDGRTAFFSGVEIENGGETVSVEHAYAEWSCCRFFGVRAGLLIVPVGLVNEWREPPTYHGAVRTSVDRFIVPTTWREGGVSVFGEPVKGLRYQVALVNGLDGTKLSGSEGLRAARGGGNQAVMNDVALAVRVDYALKGGIQVGLSTYDGAIGHDRAGLSGVGLKLIEADAHLERKGLMARGQWVRGNITEIDRLAPALEDTTDSIGSGIEGYYVELAVDPLAFVRVPALGGAEIWPFVRYDHANTQMSMADGFDPNGAYDTRAITAGVTVKCHPQVAFKADYSWNDAGIGNPPNLWHVGLGVGF